MVIIFDTKGEFPQDFERFWSDLEVLYFKLVCRVLRVLRLDLRSQGSKVQKCSNKAENIA